MGLADRVSVPALRILTYTILIKAATGAVMLACSVVAGIALRSGAAEVNAAGSVYIVCQTLEFINVVACVMCLSGIVALSKEFATTLRIMVTVLLIECFTLVPATAEIVGSIINNIALESASTVIVLTLSAAERLLLGAAFLFLLRGFGNNLRSYGENVSAAAFERLGIVYCLVSAAGVLASLLTGPNTGMPLLIAGGVISFTIIVLEVIIYIRVRGAAQTIWRVRAFGERE